MTDPSQSGVVYRRHPDALFTVVDEELIIMDAKEEFFYSSNAVGSVIWAAIETPASHDQICAAVCEAFPDAEPEAVRSDALELLEQMARRGLVEPRTV